MKVTIYRYDNKEFIELDEYVKQKQQIKELKAYTIHDIRCNIRNPDYIHETKCTCGLDELLNKH
jgi:hypothetical protein